MHWGARDRARKRLARWEIDKLEREAQEQDEIDLRWVLPVDEDGALSWDKD